MGRLIDEDILIDSIPDLSVFEQEDFGTPDMIRLIEDAPTVQAIPKADYENRLKADMVAVLTEIQLEIEEKEQHFQDKFIESKNAVHGAAMSGRMFGCGECKEIIQQKINALKAEEGGEDDK